MNRISDKMLSLQIAGLQGFYWMAFCPIASFASVYLLSKNFTNQKIGWVMAVSNILAIFLQPVIGILIDRFSRFSVKVVLTSLTSVCILLLSGLIFLKPGLLLMAVLYVGVVALLVTMQPLVNALTFEYINSGYNISFGMTRAMGSISFAILSTLLGIWLNRYSTNILPIICMVLFIGYFLLILSFPKIKKTDQQKSDLQTQISDTKTKTQKSFLRRYERFIPFLIGISCLFIFHTIINTFLAQIISSVGGKTTDFGISLTIAAVAELPAFIGFNYLVSKINTKSLLRLSGIFYVIRSAIFLLANAVWIINLGQIFQAFSFAIFIPASVYYINEIMRDEDKVKGQTFVTGTATLGSFFGSVVGGWLLDKSGVPGMLIFAVMGAAAGCLLMIYSVRKPKNTLA